MRASRMAGIGAVVVGLCLTGCGGEDRVAAPAEGDLPATPVSSGQARETTQIQSLEQFVAESDLVVIGVATAVSEGRQAGEDVGGSLGFRDVAVEIEQVLAGTYDAPSLTLEELGWKDGEPFTINDAAWAEQGDRMLLGLTATENGVTAAGPRFILTSTATRFFLGADGSVASNYLVAAQENQFVRGATELTAEQLVQQVGNSA